MAYKYNGEFRNLYLAKLIQIGLREGKCKKARGLLENNFAKNKMYYGECMVKPDMQMKSLLAIAKLHIQIGNNDIARKILETMNANHFELFDMYSLASIHQLVLNEEKKQIIYVSLPWLEQKNYNHVFCSIIK